MTRAQRRALAAAVRAIRPGSLAAPVPDSVTLEDGPMDGWTVNPDAPALRPDWWTTWPIDVARAYAPGRYVRDASRSATWMTYA